MQGRAHGVDLDLYLAGFPRQRLTSEEEQGLGSLDFGHEDRWKLVQHNMRFAVNWCFQLYNRNRLVNDFEALLGVAQDAMIEVALKRYKARGTPFVSYAVHYLRRDTAREVHRQLCVVKLPELREANRGSLREDARYQIDLDMIQDELGIPDDGLIELENSELRSHLMAELEKLVPRETDRQIVIMAYGLDGNEPMTSTEIRKSLGRFTREGIRKALLRSKKRLAKSKVLRELVA